MKQFRIILVVFFSLLLLPLNFESDSNLSAAALLQDDAYGKKTIVLDSDAQNTFALGKYIKVLKDKSKKLTSYDVFSGNFEEPFQLGRRDIINLGIINANVWIEFPTIINYSDGKQWYIVIDNESVATLRSISFYFLRDDETIHFVEIPNVKKHQLDTKSPNISIPIPTWILEANSKVIGERSIQIFAKASFLGRTDISLFIADAKTPISFYIEYFLLVFFLGALISLFLYNAFVPLFLKELKYLYYSIYLFFYVVVFLIGYYKLEVLLGFRLSYFTYLVGGLLASICIIEFVIELFRTKTFIPTGHFWLRILEGFLIITILLSFNDIILTQKISFFVESVTLVSILIIGLICFLRGQYYAKFFLLGCFVFTVTTIIWMLAVSGVITHNFFTSQVKILGLLIQTLFLPFALVDRYQLLRKKLTSANNKLKEANAQLIHVFGITVETRDPYTAGHQFRVSSLAEAIAKKMKLDPYFVENVRLSALIHDIGKIIVPKTLLSKKTKLSKVEIKKIQEHVRFGYHIIQSLDVPRIIKDGILHHHERLDGSGYPSGIKKRKISLVGKIIAVADTVEAVTNSRPYRGGLGLDKAFDIIKENKDFDKRVVKACLKVFHGGFDFPRVVKTLNI